MSQAQDNQDWRCLNVAVTDKESGVVLEYKVHEIKKGRKVLAPHLHLKLATPFKEPQTGEAELREIIASILPKLKEITE